MSKISTVNEVEYLTLDIRDIRVESVEEKMLNIGGKSLRGTERFWGSLASKYQLGSNIFNFFQPEEVFERIAKKDNSQIRVTVADNAQVLAISNPMKSLIPLVLAKALSHEKPSSMVVGTGVTTITFDPDVGTKIGKEDYKQKYVLEIPYDGYGTPRIFAMLERLVCLNGMVGMKEAFRTDIKIGKEPEYTVRRAIASYSNDSAHSFMAARLLAAQTSPASLRELRQVAEYMSKRADLKLLNRLVVKECTALSIPSPSYLSEKKQRLMPTSVSVYDLINILTEWSTHREATTESSAKINAFVAELICEEYDLEGTGSFGEFSPFYLGAA